MKLEGRSVLITGGGTGIARAIVGAGAKVLLCGRREGPLREAAAEHPGLAWTAAIKAALHAFTQGLRHQLRDTSVRVFEVIPPAVDTEPNAGATGAERERLIPPEAVAEATVRALKGDRYETTVGAAGFLRVGSRVAPGMFFSMVNPSKALTRHVPLPEPTKAVATAPSTSRQGLDRLMAGHCARS